MKGLTRKKTVIKFEQSGINRTMEYNGEQVEALDKLRQLAGKNVKVISGTSRQVASVLKEGIYTID